MRLSAKARVENGARCLDENFPGWEDRIDIKTLQLSDAAKCICGRAWVRLLKARAKARK